MRNEFVNEIGKFCNSSIKYVLTSINSMPHQLLAADMQAKYNYPEFQVNFKYLFPKHKYIQNTPTTTLN